MTQQQILEGNKQIALFMGFTESMSKYSIMSQDKILVYRRGTEIHTDNSLSYHDNWDWIMPVVETIESLGYSTYMFPRNEITIKENNTISAKNIAKVQHPAKLTAMFEACVQFVNWYNQKSK